MEEADDNSDGRLELQDSQAPSQEMSYTMDERFIGVLPISERYRRVFNYLKKKYNKAFMKKFCYSCRKQVAEKRLRIKGRFVTKEQAF